MMMKNDLCILTYVTPRLLGYKVQRETNEYGREGYTVRRDDETNLLIGGPFPNYPKIAKINSKGEIVTAIVTDPEEKTAYIIS
jgi:hypothetical protein